ncbi:hypothetical protein ACJX0J_020928 [Zea mays]
MEPERSDLAVKKEKKRPMQTIWELRQTSAYSACLEVPLSETCSLEVEASSIFKRQSDTAKDRVELGVYSKLYFIYILLLICGYTKILSKIMHTQQKPTKTLSRNPHKGLGGVILVRNLFLQEIKICDIKLNGDDYLEDICLSLSPFGGITLQMKTIRRKIMVKGVIPSSIPNETFFQSTLHYNEQAYHLYQLSCCGGSRRAYLYPLEVVADKKIDIDKKIIQIPRLYPSIILSIPSSRNEEFVYLDSTPCIVVALNLS